MNAQISPAVAFPLTDLPPPQAAFVREPEDILQEIIDDYHARTDNAFNPLLESDPQLARFEAHAYAIWRSELRIATIALNSFLAYAPAAEVEQIGNNVQVYRAEGEDLERFRYRVALSWEGRTTAGPLDSYRYHAYASSPRVLDANFKTPTFVAAGRDGDRVYFDVTDDLDIEYPRPDHVLGIILPRDDESADVSDDGDDSAALLDLVYDYLSATTLRPLNDFLQLRPASVIEYEVHATLDFYPGVDRQLSIDAAQVALDDYTASRMRLGLDIAVSGLDKALHAAGVQSVALDGWANDLAVDWDTVAKCVGTSISEGVINE